jgi:hypothetical protein
MKKDWQFSKEYKEASIAEKQMLDALSDILYEVQYAEMGLKTAARRNAALSIVKSIKTAYKLHQLR